MPRMNADAEPVLEISILQRDGSSDLAFLLFHDRADMNISGTEFNFLRAIRVFDVRHARQTESRRDVFGVWS